MKSVMLKAAACALAAAGFVSACSHRDSFDVDTPGFQDSGLDVSGPCEFQCSLDGRSVIDCNGKVLTTCPNEQACGAAKCQEPCAAAAADSSSNGCEFFFQPPMFSKRWDRGCYAAYVVNNSMQPANLKLDLAGQDLDLSKAIFTTKPGDPTPLPHSGPILPGESAIVFVSDRNPNDVVIDGVYACPAGVVPGTVVDSLPNNTGYGQAFHLTSDLPVGVSAIYPYGGASSYFPSATLLLPVATWGTQHIIVNAWGPRTIQFDNDGRGPAAQFVASEDDTEMTILPNHDIQDGTNFIGTAAQVAATYHLDRGQVLQINQGEELSGSVVTSTKPISIFGGNECANIPSTRVACDFAGQEIPPFAQWGSEYASVGYRPRVGDESELMPYRIVAARDGTRLDYDPINPAGAPITMAAGDVVTFYASVGDAFVVRTQDSDHPIYLAAYMSGGGTPSVGTDPLGVQDTLGNGDPEFVNVIPAGQYQSSYSFFADPTYQETSLVVIRGKTTGKFEDVWLECAGQNLTDWKPVGTRGNYEWTRVDLIRNFGDGQSFGGDGGEAGTNVCKSGLHRMHSNGAFTATIWGWSQYASYAYPGGTAQRRLVPTALPPLK